MVRSLVLWVVTVSEVLLVFDLCMSSASGDLSLVGHGTVVGEVRLVPSEVWSW